MALVEHWRTDFDTDAKVSKFFHSPAPGGLANIAPVRRVVTDDDAVSCIEVHVGDEVPDAEYFRTFVGANQDAYDKAVADLPNRTPGDVIYIYSTDSTKHGRYVIEAGPSLGSRTGSCTPAITDDINHRRVAQIRLWLQSWSAAGDPLTSSSLHGYPDFSVLNDSIGLPEEHNLSGWVMRWRMRAIGMSMGRNTKIVQHYQTRIPSMPLIGSADAPAFVNAINQATCISDELGFGGGGLYAPNTVEYVADSGWVDVDIPLEALWSYWLMLGGNDGEPGSSLEKMGRLPYDKALRYVAANPALWVTNWTGNAYLVEAQFNPNPDADLPVIPNSQSAKGRLLISSLSFLRAA